MDCKKKQPYVQKSPNWYESFKSPRAAHSGCTEEAGSVCTALRAQQSQMKLHRSVVQREQFQDWAKTLPITSIFWPPAFLYQEYRDTSKQQEIEQRRQRENLSPEVGSGTGAAGSSVAYPPTIQLQLRNNARSLSLWQNLEVVQNSGLLMQLPQKEVIMQEVGCVLET